MNIKELPIYQLAIITPCFNPAKGWEQNYMDTCKSIKKLLNGVEIQWILVDDGSTRGLDKHSLAKISESIDHFTSLRLEDNRGKGYAVRKGIAFAEAAHYVYTDIDFPYQNEEITKVYKALVSGGDLVIAVRGEQYYTRVNKRRTWISKRFKHLVKFLFNIPTTDTQAGLKGLSKDAREELLAGKINRYLFDLELVKRCAKKQLQIVELPVSLKEGIVLSNVSYRVLFTELFNLLRIFFQ